MSTSGRFTRGLWTLKVVFWTGILCLLDPTGLSAQAVGSDPASWDAWRARLHERLDQDLRQLRAEAQAAPPTLLNAQGNGGRGLPENSIPLPNLTLYRGAPWLPAVAAILRDQGLPTKLVGMAAVESGLNPLALSPKGARGLWQLMPRTARRYGLVVEDGRDERVDPLKSTLGAARYLKKLYAQFQDWPLALAAYNAGEDRVERSLERLRARDFWTLSRRFALPDETRRYVPAVLANLGNSSGPLALPSPTPAGLDTTEQDTPSSGSGFSPRAQVVYATTSPISKNFGK